MKKVALILAIVAGSFVAKAQGPNAVKINVMSLAVSTYNISYERSISDNISVQLLGAYMGAKIGDFKTTGTVISPSLRLYLGDEDPELKGWYVAPLLRYDKLTYDATLTSLTTTTSTVETSFTSFGGGVDFGRQWVTGGGFVIDWFIGFRYAAGKTTIDGDFEEEDISETVGYEGIIPRLGLKLGYSF